MLDEPVAEADPVIPGNQPHEISLGTDGVGVLGESQPSANPPHVGVYDHARGDAKGRPQHHVGRFSADSGEADDDRVPGSGSSTRPDR